jgi:multidrug resistance efflux pump
VSRDDDALGSPYYAPKTMARVKAKKQELEAKVAAGEITAEEARAEYQRFASLAIAHHREHGSESEWP